MEKRDFSYRRSIAVIKDHAAALAKIQRRISIDASLGCHIWEGALNDAGYGVVSIEGQQWSVHRVMYEIGYGLFDGNHHGKHVCHKCDVPACCNPDHLYLGTPAQNNRDAAIRCRIRVGYRWGQDNGDRKAGTVFYEYKGQIKELSEWSEHLGIDTSTLDRRFQKGWPEDEIPSPPAMGYKRKVGTTQYRRFSGEQAVKDYLKQREEPAQE
jgi:hypothetical protein